MCESNGPLSPAVYKARRAHHLAMEYSKQSRRWRAERNKQVRIAFKEGTTCYRRIAAEVGCSQELIAKIIRER